MLEVVGPPAILGPREEAVEFAPARSTLRPSNAGEYPGTKEYSGRVMLHGRDAGAPLRGVRDGNRSIILPEAVAQIRGRSYALSFKGVGARPPLYGDLPVDFAFRSDFGLAPDQDTDELELQASRAVAAESWFGESPYGAQGELPAAYSLMVTEFSKDGEINGFHVCPTVEVNELPEEVTRVAESRWWYRRNRGKYLQEQRWVPSNVRVYHESEWTLGQSPAAVLRAFGVLTPQDADAFIENYIRSGIAALTVYVRTMRQTKWGYRGLDYGDVYLDKDAVIGPDGTMHFVDIEGLDWVLGGADVPVGERVREQFNYNFYEVMYGLDLVLRERENLAGRVLRQDERRFDLPERFEMALGRDPFVRCERNGDRLDLVVRPPFAAVDPVPIPLLDLR